MARKDGKRTLIENDLEKTRVIETSKKALACLRQAKRDLDGAFLWGIFDIVGGMYVISGIKLARIEAAKGHIREAMGYLSQFRREMDQTDYVNKSYMHLGLVGTVLDFGIDGIVPDVYAQTRINGLRRRVKEAIRRLETILRSAGVDVN